MLIQWTGCCCAGSSAINHVRYRPLINLPIHARRCVQRTYVGVLYIYECVWRVGRAGLNRLDTEQDRIYGLMQIKLYHVQFGTYTRLLSDPILVYSLRICEIAVFPINYDNREAPEVHGN